MAKRSIGLDLRRLDRRMAFAAITAQQASENHELIAMIGRVLRDSAERHRGMVRLLQAIRGAKTLPDAKRLARDYLESLR